MEVCFKQCPWTIIGFTFLTWGAITLYRRCRRHRKEVIVFSRYPRPGKAKTRMIPALGEVGACLLQTAMTEHIMKSLAELQTQMKKRLSVTVQYNGGTEADMKFWLDRRLATADCAFRPQAEGSLGDKLRLAFRDSFRRGNKQVVVIGADIPGIKPHVVQDAFSALSSDPPADMVIGRAADGGYYLIGFNSTADTYMDDMFLEIDWGTDKVFSQQVNRAKHLGLTPTVLTHVLSDVDTQADLAVFEEEVEVARQQLTTSGWSVVIPALNEEKVIATTLADVVQKCCETNNILEIIVSNGGSSDKTVDIVQEFSETSPIPVKVVHSKPGRGFQLSAGANAAKGDNFLFLHADTKLPKGFDVAASKLLQAPGIAGGAFEFQMDVLEYDALRASESWWFIQQMRFIVWSANRRAKKLELPYGDQALFMSRRTYQEVGGFPTIYLMEDFVLVERLKRVGHIGIVDGKRAVTSYRRWRKYGEFAMFRVSVFNYCVVMLYKLGVHPNTLARWYYGKRLKTT